MNLLMCSNLAAVFPGRFPIHARRRDVKGLRPGFSNGAAPEQAERLYEYFVARCRDTGLATATGRFAADMQVSLINDGRSPSGLKFDG